MGAHVGPSRLSCVANYSATRKKSGELLKLLMRVPPRAPTKPG